MGRENSKKALKILAPLALAALCGCESPYTLRISTSSPVVVNRSPAADPRPSQTPAAAPTPPPVPVVCDAFGNSGKGSSTNGLLAKLYYLDAGNPMGYTTTDEFIAYGHSPDMNFIFSQLNVVPYNFDQGFVLPDGTLLKDPQGNVMTAYFGFQFKTVLALAPGDAPGYYQIGTLSDDGSSVRIMNSNGSLTSLVEDEGWHSLQLGCGNQAIYFDSTTRIPVQINWHQGPPVRIGMMMLWRKVSGPSADLSDPRCGVPYEHYYFDTSTSPNTPAQGWSDLQAAGWRTLGPLNYFMPNSQVNSCALN